MTKKTC